jgi:mevalonate kinase
VGNAAADDPLRVTVLNTLANLGVELGTLRRRLTVSIHSSIPVASGLGSGAAVAAAVARALGLHLGQSLDAGIVSAIAYETERLHHGTPSGIDNTVVSFGEPVYYKMGCPIETFAVKRPFCIAVADTGEPSLTKETVADVRGAWERSPAEYERIFDQIGSLADAARDAIEYGTVHDRLGALMAENQRLLRRLGVSSPELEALILAALDAGAQGAKLSGGGRGGNMIALVDADSVDRVQRALLDAGARRVILTEVGRYGPA